VEFLESTKQSMSLTRESKNTINSTEAEEKERLEEREESEERECMPQPLSHSSGVKNWDSHHTQSTNVNRN
jgi:hypothetical protein